MSKTLSYYCQKFSRLRVDRKRTRGIAPHKPILLLSVIELVEQGSLKKNRIFLSPELIATFLKFWDQLGSELHRPDIAPRKNSDILTWPLTQPTFEQRDINANEGQVKMSGFVVTLPFFHMRSEGFWHLKANLGFESVISSQIRLKTLRALKDAVQHAYLDDELFDWLQNPSSRSSLVNILITTWFSEKAQQIESSLQINAFQDFQNQLRETGGAVYQAVDVEDEAKAIVRDAAFRKIIVSVYDYRCALCGLQIIDTLNQNIVDGAHIKPFAIFYDDRIDNGISLCKNHHWAFDRSWFSIEDDYTVLISDSLREDSPHATPMREFHGHTIRLPSQEQYRPRIEAIRWHRENVFGNLSV